MPAKLATTINLILVIVGFCASVAGTLMAGSWQASKIDSRITTLETYKTQSEAKHAKDDEKREQFEKEVLVSLGAIKQVLGVKIYDQAPSR